MTQEMVTDHDLPPGATSLVCLADGDARCGLADIGGIAYVCGLQGSDDKFAVIRLLRGVERKARELGYTYIMADTISEEVLDMAVRTGWKPVTVVCRKELN